MGGTFDRRIRDLIDAVGEGRLVGRVVVDQRYAAKQHNDATLRHPRGGQAFYLSDPLMGKHRQYLGQLADSVLRPGELPRTMADIAEDLAGEVYEKAPVEFVDLKRSGHPIVEDNGTVTYDRAPEVPRLTDAQLDAKDRARAAGHVPGR